MLNASIRILGDGEISGTVEGDDTTALVTPFVGVGVGEQIEDGPPMSPAKVGMATTKAKNIVDSTF